MRDRMIRSGFWDDPKMGSLSRDARLLYIGTWTLADDAGHVRVEPAYLRSHLFPYDDSLTLAEVERWLGELVSAARLMPYQVEGERYAQIPKFLAHQKIDRPSMWRWPPPNAQTCADGKGSSQPRLGLGSGSSLEVEVEGEVEGEVGNPSSADADKTGDFAQFWAEYPERDGKKLDKGKALAQWERLSQDQRRRALIGVVHYRAVCDGGVLARDAFRWLRDKAFEDWQTPAAPQAAPKGSGNVTGPKADISRRAFRQARTEMGLDPDGGIHASQPSGRKPAQVIDIREANR